MGVLNNGLKIGERAYCAGHKGTLVAFYAAPDIGEYGEGQTELYGVIYLDEPYKAQGPDGITCYIHHLTVHHNNLSSRPERFGWEEDSD